MSEEATDSATGSSDHASFRSLVEENKRAIYYLALDLSGNHHDAEDLSQEVFMKAHRGLASFRGDSGMEAWLRRITVNTFLNKKRKKALRFMQLFTDGQEDLITQTQFASPDERTEADILREHVNKALVRLSDSERSAFVLRHFQDLTVREVAASMGVADGTVKSLLFRATKKMQKSLSFYRTDSSFEQA